MNRRILAAIGGALPAFVCVAIALPVLAQEGLEAGADADAGVIDGGSVDGGGQADADVVVSTPPVVASPLIATPMAPQNQPLEPGADVDTGVKGHVYDAKTKQPMAMAPVLLKGAGKTRTALTDEQGGYRFLLPPGAYSLMSYYDLYHGARIKGVKVSRGKLLNLNLMLFPLDENEEVSIQEFEIAYRADTTSAAAQDQLRLASSSIGEGFGAKQMSQVGASDAGGAASRVVGVQVESNQLVVRGLGGRYTRVLLNGVPVPSTDPDLPGADLDLFPTDVIDSLTVSKTFLPSSPADFAGGLMEIKSVTFPRKFTFELKLATGYKSEGTLRKVLTYEGGSHDYLGTDDGSRQLPDAIPSDAQVIVSRMGRYKTFDALAEPSKSFRNVWTPTRTTALPPLGLSLNIGDSKKFGNGHRFGYIATASYDYEKVRKTGSSRPRPVFEPDGRLVPANDYRTESGTEEVSLNAFASASLDIGSDHSLTALTLYNQSLSDETQVRQGTSSSTGQPVKNWQLEFLSRSLSFNQLFGEHRNLFGTRLRLRWLGFQSSGQRSTPDQRVVTYAGITTDELQLDSDGTQRLFSSLHQNDIGFTSSLRFPLWPEAWGTIGAWTQTTSRDFSIRRFRFRSPGGNADLTQTPELIFSPETAGTLWRAEESTFRTDSYEAKQSLLAAYAQLETPIVGKLSFAGGARYEVFPQKMEVVSPFASTQTKDPNVVTETDRKDSNFLPGGNLKYSLSENMLLRGAFGITVSRPMARELAPFLFFDFVRDRSISGNPELKSTVIKNADLRWEWFLGEGEVLATSVFYKKFSDPIELVILDQSYQGQFRNGKAATNFGAESEVRLNLGRFTNALKNFNFDGNFSLIRSRVEFTEADKGSTAGTRRLFGQAPYLLNLGLRFNQPDTKLSASLVYNLVGPRITDVGVLVGEFFLPNIEQQPFHSVDAIGGVQLTPHLKTRLKVKNLLFQEVRYKQGDFDLQRVRPGISVSLSMSYEY